MVEKEWRQKIDHKKKNYEVRERKKDRRLEGERRRM